MAEQESTLDLAGYLTKPATSLQARFANYLQEEVGYNPNAAKTKLEAFQEGVRLSTALRMIFQASDYNRDGRAAEAAEKAAAATNVEPKPAKAAKAAKATAPAAKATKAAKAATAPAKAAPTRRRGAAAATAPASTDEAPF